MTTHQLTHDSLQAGDAPLHAALAYVAATGFRDAPVGDVGLELEFLVVDVRDSCRRPEWLELCDSLCVETPMPRGSRISLEPGGQVELSTPPMADVATAIEVLASDRAALADRLAPHHLGLVSIGADPARAPRRINPAARYGAMEQHFDALGHGPSGRAMMTVTAALQINVNAGPRRDWAQRFGHLTRLAPVLTAISACSPLLSGNSSGWASMRQQAWFGIDSRRAGAFSGDSAPDEAWARYAMRAPVMLIRDHDTGAATPMRSAVPFGAWWSGQFDPGRRATPDDLDYHLTTLFPPVRPKGYFEFRPLDAMPLRWWPAVAAVAVTLMDDPVAVDAAADALDGLELDLEHGARAGLADPTLAAVALRCVTIAAERVPAALAPEVSRLVDLVASGRSPGAELHAVATQSGPIAILQEELRA